MRVSKPTIISHDQFIQEYFDVYGKHFDENEDPAPVCFYEKNQNNGHIKLDKLKTPKGGHLPDDLARLSQKERDDYNKTKKA